MAMTAEVREELGLLLRPAGGGVHVVSTGKAEQLAMQRRLYRVEAEAEVQVAFERSLERIAQARVVVLGVPSDVGAGFRRGANLGPQAIRAALLDRHASFLAEVEDAVVDIGDVRVVPQLLSDEMLSESQLAATRAALYPGRESLGLPVAPLSIQARVLRRVLEINPGVRPFVLGGDHSVAWPLAEVLAARHPALGIVQPDAHTDLLAERLGVRICFATWSYHANDLIGRGGRLVQVGIRASGFSKEYWEGTLGVRQFWGDECRSLGDALPEAVVAHLRAVGVRQVYFSNDIDGTDAAWASATGTPERGGVEPQVLRALIARLGEAFELVGADLVEVAPPLGPTPADTERTVALAADYARDTIAALLR